MSTSVSVVICTWNRARMLAQTLDSFLRLRIPEGVTWELMVVNNNCSDDTDDVVKSYVQRLPIVLCHEPQPGKSNACNHAIAKARGEYLLWTDDDVVVPTDWLAENLKAFEEFQADMVFGKVVPWWESAPPSWYSRQFDGLFALLDYGADPFVVSDQKHQPYGVNMATRREVFDRVGGFTNDVGMLKNTGGGCEDLELFLRIKEQGLRVAYTPTSVIHHFIPDPRCTKAFYRSRAWFGSFNHFHMMQKETTDQQRLLGLPRYYFRVALGQAGRYFKAMVGRDRSSAFFYELKMIRFAGLMRQAIREAVRVRRSTPHARLA